jgi:hypothetical protein
MSTALQFVLQHTVQLPGVAQAFYVLPDRTVQSAGAPGQPIRPDEAWVALADTLDSEGLDADAIGAREVLWTFDTWSVLLCKSSEGIFGALVEREASEKTQTKIRSLMEKAGVR